MDIGFSSFGYGGAESYGGGGGGGFEDGGFMPGNDHFGMGGDQQGLGGSNDGGNNSGGGRGRGDAIDSIVPVTVKMILNASIEPDDSFTIDGKTVSKIVTYAKVISKEPKTTNVVYKFDDGTGQVSGVQWIQSDEKNYSKEAREMIQEGTYLCINGQLRSFENQKNILIFHARPVVDGNEITHHLLHTAFVHLQATQGPINKQIDPNYNDMNNGLNMDNTPNMNSNSNSGGGINDPYNSGAPLHMGGLGNMPVLTPLQATVLQLINDDNGDERGQSLDVVAQRLQGQVSMHEIREAATFLSNEGHVYSTIDDDHFKTTGVN